MSTGSLPACTHRECLQQARGSETCPLENDNSWRPRTNLVRGRGQGDPPAIQRDFAMRRILITGSGGFVGQHLVPRLAADGHALTLAVRSSPSAQKPTQRIRTVAIGGISGRTDWMPALEGCDVVVHLAAQTPARGVSENTYFSVNADGTARLCEQAAQAGVSRFLMMSSIFAVVDNASDAIVSDQSRARATSPYGRSKLAAEMQAQAFASAGRTVVTLRPPLVYGAAAKGNWRLLQRMSALGLPLPLARVRNRRSLISVDNLVDAIATVVGSERPAGTAETFALADGDAVSTADMVRLLREGMGLLPRLYPVPPAALSTALGLMSTSAARSLLGDLEVDARRFRETFAWSSPRTAEDAIRRSGAGFIASRGVR